MPKSSSPIVNSTHPAKNPKRIIKSSGMSLVNSMTKIAIRDVGPIDTSLILPKKT